MRWRPFVYQNRQYDLSHLHSKTVIYTKPAKDGKPEIVYRVNVTYSLHCFTRKMQPGENPDTDLFYRDDMETRVFDFDRWRMSLCLPTIIESLTTRKCLHTGYGNFLTVEAVDDQGVVKKYEVYFQVSRSTLEGHDLNLFVQSAYVPVGQGKPKQRHNPPIQFAFILYNTIHSKPIKVPPR